jgi:hypothetical protein
LEINTSNEDNEENKEKRKASLAEWNRVVYQKTEEDFEEA